jgi:hypothetical protein
MGIFHEFNTTSVIAELKCRGLNIDQIDRALRKIVGRDWKELSVVHWRRRMVQNGLIAHTNEDQFIEDVEALVLGTAMLEELDGQGPYG